MAFNIAPHELNDYLAAGEFGIEKESLRINERGNLSHTPHPFKGNEHIDRDFCENQVEIITGVHSSVKGVADELYSLQKEVTGKLLTLPTGKEYLWAFSNPPYVNGEEDIPVASFEGRLKGKEIYRNYLAGKYGKKKMLFSGIHVNFSLAEDFLRSKYPKDAEISYEEYKNSLYLELAEKVTKYSWLIVYLTAASPLFDSSYYECAISGSSVLSKYASPRCGEEGYWNNFVPYFDFTSLKTYADSIQSYINSGQLRAASELYYPIRLKAKGDNSLENLVNGGVSHIELRMFDLNPLSPIGIDVRDLDFINVLLLYLLTTDKEPFSFAEQAVAIRNMKRAALYDESKIVIERGWYDCVSVNRAARTVLTDIKKAFVFAGKKVADTVDYQLEKVVDPLKRYAKIISSEYGNGYVAKGIELSKRYSRQLNGKGEQ